MAVNILNSNVTNEHDNSKIFEWNITNLSAANVDLVSQYRHVDMVTIESYRNIAIVVGIIVVLVNTSVVVSSGLILKKGQQPKNTYLLLGNVSLADTVVGLSMIISATGKKTLASNSWCVFKIGMITCPALVSILTVTLIVVDRYCYILHGLYYHRCFTSTKARISVVITWFIGFILGFLPVTGWVNNEYGNASCLYITLFPDTLILINSFISIGALGLIVILYSIILIHALRNVNEIKATKKVVSNKTSSLPNTNLTTLAIHRGNGNNTQVKDAGEVMSRNKYNHLKRSASFSDCRCIKWTNVHSKSKSIHDIFKSNENHTERPKIQKRMTQRCSIADSDYSVISVELNSSEQNISHVDVSKNIVKQETVKNNVEKPKRKIREPCKLRAIIVVLLTSGSIIIAWLPFFVSVIFYVLCENKRTNIHCLEVRRLLDPFTILAFLNSILNPLIYAWWHKGFQKTIKNYYRRYIYNCKARNS